MSERYHRERRDALREAYEAAVRAGQEQFTFRGLEYDTGYARYLLEYLDSKLGE